jgi:hypothetical protein
VTDGFGVIVGVIIALSVGVGVEGMGLLVGSNGGVVFVQVGKKVTVSKAAVLVWVQETERMRINNRAGSRYFIGRLYVFYVDIMASNFSLADLTGF